MRKRSLLFISTTLLIAACKSGPKDYLRTSQWVADSYKINDVELMETADAYRQLRYTFYMDGTMNRTSYAGEYNGTYFLDDENLSLLLLQEDTVNFKIILLNAVDLQIGGRNGADSIYISAYH